MSRLERPLCSKEVGLAFLNLRVWVASELLMIYRRLCGAV